MDLELNEANFKDFGRLLAQMHSSRGIHTAFCGRRLYTSQDVEETTIEELEEQRKRNLEAHTRRIRTHLHI